MSADLFVPNELLIRLPAARLHRCPQRHAADRARLKLEAAGLEKILRVVHPALGFDRVVMVVPPVAALEKLPGIRRNLQLLRAARYGDMPIARLHAEINVALAHQMMEVADTDERM